MILCPHTLPRHTNEQPKIATKTITKTVPTSAPLMFHSAYPLRMVRVAKCRQNGNISSKMSDFKRPKKAIFESDKEILEIGQRDFF